MKNSMRNSILSASYNINFENENSALRGKKKKKTKKRDFNLLMEGDLNYAKGILFNNFNQNEEKSGDFEEVSSYYDSFKVKKKIMKVLN